MLRGHQHHNVENCNHQTFDIGVKVGVKVDELEDASEDSNGYLLLKEQRREFAASDDRQTNS